MSDHSLYRLEDLFQRAADLTPERRAAFLDAECGGDAELRRAVEALLQSDHTLGGSDDFLRGPVGAGRDEPGVPERVGCYRVIRLLGAGGMGVVYEAQQESPRRTVALKVVHAGLPSPNLVKRFAREAEVLARLHHPGIAQVYEAGVADGRPYFAMELIAGVPLDEFCRRGALDPRACLELVAKVADAVQHAHEQGVIHRDLKPGNILVEESGQPRVLDFGVARVADPDLQSPTSHTEAGQLLGTLRYMSPEQVSGDPAAMDRRSDVYALGVILYELLAHRMPYDLEQLPLPEAARRIREEEPWRLGSIDARLRGDVETIVAKALEKDPARRYPSAAELAADLRRWLAHEPIRARPPSALYQLRQFARRHTGLVGGVLATGLALVLGLVFTTLFAVGEARQRRQADEEKREAQFQAYRARTAAAVAALSVHDVADAARQLQEAPEELRDWEWRHLHSRLDDSAAVLPLPAGSINAFLSGAPDRLQAGAWTPAGLWLTELEAGEPRTLPLGPKRPLSVCATQTRRGLRVAVWVGNTSFDLLDEAGRVLCRVEIPEARAGSVVVSPDSTRLAYVFNDGERWRLAVCDATTGKRRAVCDGQRDGVLPFTFSPDGTRLASGGEDRMARLWDAASGALLATCRGHTSKVLSTAFRPDGARLVTTSADGTVRQWDTATGQEVEPPYDRHTAEGFAAVYNPDGQWVASAGADRTVRVWRATGRQDVAVLHGHRGNVTGVAFAADGRRLTSLSREWLAQAGDDTVRVWDVDPGATLPVLRGHTSYVYPVAFSPDGRWLASGGWDGKARVWDAATGELCATLPHPDYVLSLAFLPEGPWLVTGSYGDDRLRIWDLATARLLRDIPGPGRNFRSLSVSPDGRRVAAYADGPQLRVCDLRSGERLFAAAGRSLAYSPDCRWLAVVWAEDENTVALLDAQTYETVARFPGHEKPVHSAAFSPDSRRLASCSVDHTVRVWQVDSGACQVLHGHTDEVFAAAFHPDGTRLATGGRDRAIWLWDLKRGDEVARLPGHTSYVWSLAWSPDGTTLASGSGDFTVRLWDTAPLKTRYQARREAEALRPEAERLVEQLWRQKNDPAEVAEALWADGALSEPLRQAALRAVLRRAQPPTDVPGKPHDPP
jgi:WD40 repeat protein